MFYFFLRLEGINYRQSVPEYDFIIVGAGAAGCVLANRLSENPQWKILLLEAGPGENDLQNIPLLTTFLQNSQYNWADIAEAQNTSCYGKYNERLAFVSRQSNTMSINF